MAPAMDLQYTQHGPLYIGYIFFIVLFFLTSWWKETGPIFIWNLIENKHITYTYSNSIIEITTVYVAFNYNFTLSGTTFQTTGS